MQLEIPRLQAAPAGGTHAWWSRGRGHKVRDAHACTEAVPWTLSSLFFLHQQNLIIWNKCRHGATTLAFALLVCFFVNGVAKLKLALSFTGSSFHHSSHRLVVIGSSGFSGVTNSRYAALKANQPRNAQMSPCSHVAIIVGCPSARIRAQACRAATRKPLADPGCGRRNRPNVNLCKSKAGVSGKAVEGRVTWILEHQPWRGVDAAARS